MGSNESKPVRRAWRNAKEDGVDMDLVEEVVEYLDDMPGGMGDATNDALRGLLERIKDPDADDPDFALLKIVKDEKVKVMEFGRKGKAKQAFQKAKRRGHAAVMLKGGKIHEGRCTGDQLKVTFVIGLAFGKGWCDLGPLNDEGSEYCIFEEGDDDEDDEDGSDDDEDDDDNWHLIKTQKDEQGISDEEFGKKKKAYKKFKKVCNKGRAAVLIKGGKIKAFSGDGDDGGDMDGDEMVKRLTFMIGVAFGRDMIEDLGPLEDDGPIAILEDDFEDMASSDED